MAVTFNIDPEDDIGIRQKAIIEGVVYKIHTYWNYRSGWYLGLYNENEEPIITGIKVMPNANLFSNIDLFEGQVWCIDTQKVVNQEQVLIDNFGPSKRYQIIYFTKTEIESLV